MFRRKTKPTYDSFIGEARHREAHAALVRGDWRPAQTLMEEPGDRSFVVTGLTQDTATPTAAYQRWVADRPSSLSGTVLAVHLTGVAWDIRGGGYAETVGTDSWNGFAAKLSEAETAAREAVRLGPSLADAWAALLQVSVGQARGMEVIDQCFQQAHALQPFHNRATSRMLQARCNKWYGSHEDMFSFARWVKDRAQPGSPAQSLVVRAHHERWASMSELGVPSGQYFSQPDVQTEVLQTATRFLEATPSGPSPIELVEANAWFLFGLGRSQSNSKATVNELVSRIDGRVTEWPWVVVAGPTPAASYSSFIRRLT